MGVWTELGQLVLAAVFVFAAASKLREPRRWRTGVAEFIGRSGFAASLTAVAVPAAELGIAVALVTPARSAAAVAALVLLAGFSLGIAANLARGRSVSCNCFGAGEEAA